MGEDEDRSDCDLREVKEDYIKELTRVDDADLRECTVKIEAEFGSCMEAMENHKGDEEKHTKIDKCVAGMTRLFARAILQYQKSLYKNYITKFHITGTESEWTFYKKISEEHHKYEERRESSRQFAEGIHYTKKELFRIEKHSVPDRIKEKFSHLILKNESHEEILLNAADIATNALEIVLNRRGSCGNIKVMRKILQSYGKNLSAFLISVSRFS